ncbi:hypothetical protein CLOM_g4352 [Closterium sp. NIES-68]|nr:hypothetical protein CLOM_g4352 [Closterium sp. NIES-68]
MGCSGNTELPSLPALLLPQPLLQLPSDVCEGFQLPSSAFGCSCCYGWCCCCGAEAGVECSGMTHGKALWACPADHYTPPRARQGPMVTRRVRTGGVNLHAAGRLSVGGAECSRLLRFATRIRPQLLRGGVTGLTAAPALPILPWLTHPSLAKLAAVVPWATVAMRLPAPTSFRI